MQNSVGLFTKLKRALIPLSGKVPISKKWVKRKYNQKQIQRFVRQDKNLGWQLAPTDLIVDVDPRNDGLTGLKVLLEDIGFKNLAEVRKEYAVVKTGGGGFHIYMAKEPEIKTRKKVVERYGKGIDFLSYGAQCLIPGCIHPETKKPYKFDGRSPFQQPAKLAPLALVKILSKQKTRKEQQVDEDGGITRRELKKILEQIPVDDFGNNDDWFNLMCAAHQATGGKGFKQFLQWSLQDERYAGQGEQIQNRWDSLSSDKGELITAKTLFSTLIEYDGTPPVSISNRQINEYFADEFSSDAPDEPSLVERKAERIKERKENPPTNEPNQTRIEKQIDALNRDSSAKDLTKVLRKVARCKFEQQTLYVRDVALHTGLTKTEVKRLLELGRKRASEVDSETVEDLALQVTTELLDKDFKGGAHLIHATDQRYWDYTGKMWQPKQQNMIDQNVFNMCFSLKRNHPEHEFSIASLMMPAERILRAKVATDEDLFRFEHQPKPIINVNNGELHIDTATGKPKLKEHNHKSYLINCLENVEYNPDAEAPKFMKALRKIFAKEENPEELVQFVLEIFGYTIQPKKNIPAWFLLYGTGSNGKSTVMRVLSALLQGAVLETSIRDFDTAKNNHAYEMLPGKLCILDDDIRAKTVLPDDFLKKVSENKHLTCNPKGLKAFRFLVGATPILACNHWPKINDVSEGMLRRAFVIPFRQTFKSKQSSYNLDVADEIIDEELPGVLNLALKGLERLRRRGMFKVPYSCENAKRQWQYGSNPSLAFIHDMVLKSNGGKASAKELYGAYCEWCDDQEIEYKYRQTKRALGETMRSMGFKNSRGSGGVTVYRNITIQGKEDE